MGESSQVIFSIQGQKCESRDTKWEGEGELDSGQEAYGPIPEQDFWHYSRLLHRTSLYLGVLTEWVGSGKDAKDNILMHYTSTFPSKSKGFGYHRNGYLAGGGDES